jgi:hypothetical protein
MPRLEDATISAVRPYGEAVERCTCTTCGKVFKLPAWAVRRGRGKFCSHACYAASKKGTARPELLRRITKTCVVCGKEFETGGRAGSKTKAICSMECQRVSRYRHGRKCAELTPLDAAYLAGFWDGEGTFMLHGRSGPGSTIAFRATVVGSKEQVIRWVKDVTGIGTIVAYPSKNEKWSEKWVWAVNGDGAESFTRQLLPYLKLKREHAELCVEFQERLRDPKLKADRSWQDDWRQLVSALNRRGPTLKAAVT